MVDSIPLKAKKKVTQVESLYHGLISGVDGKENGFRSAAFLHASLAVIITDNKAAGGRRRAREDKRTQEEARGHKRRR